MILVDTNVLLDDLLNHPNWSTWSIAALEMANASSKLAINPVIYTEVSLAFERIEELEQLLAAAEIGVESIPREALFLAGKVFLKCRERQGSASSALPDCLIGAHAAVANAPILTRDAGRYRTYFPTVQLISPDASAA